jgi:hypothetical protein
VNQSLTELKSLLNFFPKISDNLIRMKILPRFLETEGFLKEKVKVKKGLLNEPKQLGQDCGNYCQRLKIKRRKYW